MEKRRSTKKDLIVDIAAILLGSALVALGIVIFTVPNHLAPGGVSGLATAVSHVTNLPIGVLSLLFNVPIFLVAFRIFGIRSLLRTLISTVLLSLFIDLFTSLGIAYTNNVLLASVLGGAVVGVGMGFLFSRGITTGGTDLIASILRVKFPQLPMGTLLTVIDVIVVIVAVVVFRDVEIALYSGVVIFVTGRVIDAIMQGIDYAKIIMVITDQPEEILRVLTQEMERGVTELPAKGGWTRENKSILLTVAHRSEMAASLKAIKNADPKSFIIMYNATEVHGEGFKEIIL